MTTFKDAIRQVFPTGTFLDELPASSDLAQMARRLESAYTMTVAGLRMHNNARLATLGRALWDIMHYRHAHTALHDGVSVLTFAVIGKGGQPQGIILMPPQWVDLVIKEPLMGVGGVIFTGSQVVDFYNDRLSDGPAVARAYSYESEFLKDQRLPLNGYQKQVRREYPGGFDAEKYGYDYRPVAPGVS